MRKATRMAVGGAMTETEVAGGRGAWWLLASARATTSTAVAVATMTAVVGATAATAKTAVTVGAMAVTARKTGGAGATEDPGNAEDAVAVAVVAAAAVAAVVAAAAAAAAAAALTLAFNDDVPSVMSRYEVCATTHAQHSHTPLRVCNRGARRA